MLTPRKRFLPVTEDEDVFYRQVLSPVTRPRIQDVFYRQVLSPVTRPRIQERKARPHSGDQSRHSAFDGYDYDEGGRNDVLECGRLITRSSSSHLEQALVIHLGSHLTIGRDAQCSFQLDDPSLSAKHCSLYALRSDTGHTFVCLEDHSTNGTLWNGRLVHHSAVLLSHGDQVEIAGRTFKYTETGPSDNIDSVISLQRTKDYLILDKTLGSGAFGSVHLAFDTKRLRQVACKKIPISKLDQDKKRAKAVRNEISVLKNLSHPNINTIYDVVETARDLNIILEIVSGGDLFSYFEQHGNLAPAEAKFIFFQVLTGVRYLHEERNISHRDLKLENIILQGNGPFPTALIADFGASRSAMESCTEFNGTFIYAPPEALVTKLCEKGYDGKAFDMWSLGVMLHVLLAGSHPFSGGPVPVTKLISTKRPLNELEQETILQKVLEDLKGRDQLFDNEEELWTCVRVIRMPYEEVRRRFKDKADDQAMRKLLRGLIEKAPSKRLKIDEALGSDWIVRSKKDLDRLYERVVVRKLKPNMPSVSTRM